MLKTGVKRRRSFGRTADGSVSLF